MKKMINKMKQFFGLDEHEIDDSYEQPVEQEQEYEAPRPTAVTQPAVEEQTKKVFRFPLAEDQAEQQRPVQAPKKTEKKSAVFKDFREDDTLRLPKHIPAGQQQTLDVEVSGIRQLLEKRGRQIDGNAKIVRTQREQRTVRPKLHVTQEESTFLTNNPSRKDELQVQENPAFINPLQHKKRFTPTHVPSPVHGFQQPRPIKELMKEERNLDLNIPVIFEAEEVIPTAEHVAAEKQNGATLDPAQQLQVESQEIEKTEPQQLNEQQQLQEETSETQEATPEQLPPAALQEAAKEPKQEPFEAAAQAEPQATDIQRINELQLQNVTFENSTVHIGQIHVEPAPVEKPVVQQVETKASIPENISPEIKRAEATTKSNGSKLPFNVLMLKSDKEKIQVNPLEAIKAGVPKTIVDKVEIRREAQHGLKQAGMPLPEELQDDADGDLTTKLSDEKVAHNVQAAVVPNVELSHMEQQRSIEEEQPVQQLDEIEQQLLENYKATQQQVAEALGQAPESAAVATLERELVLEEFVQRAEDDFEEERLAQIAVTEQSQPAPKQMIMEPSHQAAPIEQTVVIEEAPQQTSIDIDEVLQMDQQLQAIVETVHPPVIAEPTTEVKRYEKPSFDFLVRPEQKTEDVEWMEEQAEYLIEALQSHQIQAQVESIVQGPAVTQFEITVAAGTKVSKVRNLSDDIKLALAAKDIRIDAPIPGKRTIGIEIPNRISRAVRLSEVTESDTFKDSDSPLEAALGLDLNGKPVTIDLRKMPHGLIAGATGSGKSVCINSILVSLLYKADPHELKLMLIDPKMVELAPFNHIPHLVSPVITDVKAATAALKWAVEEMERRYELFMHAGVRDITRYNSQAEKAGKHAQKMPYLLIVIDELADLMMMSPADVEEAICRIAQKARACGIHLIVATQRPSVDVITGLIKSNIPTRIAFAVSSAVDSRTILDGQGAERLLGRGDMLYLGNGMSAPVRLQGTFVTDDEIEEIIDYVRSQGEPNYLFQHDELLKKAEFVEEQDELFEEVCRYVFEQGSASTSAIQRRYHLGYNRAARLVDMLERNGFVSEQRGSKPREVFITEADLENLFS